jgi:hypothetical protein
MRSGEKGDISPYVNSKNDSWNKRMQRLSTDVPVSILVIYQKGGLLE